MRGGVGGRKKMGVKDRRGRGVEGGEEGKEKRQGREWEEKEKTAMGTEKERKTSTGLPCPHSLSLSSVIGLDFRVYLQNTLCPH